MPGENEAHEKKSLSRIFFIIINFTEKGTKAKVSKEDRTVEEKVFYFSGGIQRN